MGNFKEDIARVRAFVLDVDGVMTDGGIIPTPDGDFVRRYHAQDGYAIPYAADTRCASSRAAAAICCAGVWRCWALRACISTA